MTLRGADMIADLRSALRPKLEVPAKASRNGPMVRSVAVFAYLIFGAATAEAGTVRGKMGGVSRATIGISVSVAPRMEVVRAGAPSATELVRERSIRASQPLCVWGNTSLGTYNVTVKSDVIRFPSTNDGKGEFNIEWESFSRAAEPVTLAGGSTLRGLSAATAIHCGGERTAGVVLTMPVHDATIGDPRSAHGAALLLIVAPD